MAFAHPQIPFFHQGKLTLLNTCNKLSYQLILEVQEDQLLVACNCGHGGSTICEHADGALFTILWRLGEHYFEKLQPDGAMALAFAYKSYFDKKESVAGMDVSPRPELETVYRLAPKMERVNLSAVLQLPAAPVQPDIPQHDEALAYLLITPSRNKLLPSLLPCLGNLSKDRTGIKSFSQFLRGLQKQYDNLLTGSQKEMNQVCYQLWKQVEKLPGHIIQEFPAKKNTDALLSVFEAWQKIFPVLQKQPFLYSYYLYGVRELKKRPAKNRIQRIVLSLDSPTLKFQLSDKGAIYQLEMQVSVNGKLLSGYDPGTTLFIQHQKTFYLLGSLRDAAVAEWMHRSGGLITVFKEHFAQFEQGILTPLQTHYTVHAITPRKRSKDLNDLPIKSFALHHSLVQSFSSQQEKLLSLILEASQPDRIYLLGVSTYHRRSESIFCTAAPVSRHIADYFVLILIDNTNHRPIHEWLDKIEQHCNAVMPVTTIVLESATFAEWLKTGHPFARTVWQSSSLLYNGDNISFLSPGHCDIQVEQKALEKLFMDGLNKAQEFLAGADFFRLRLQNKMAAFMLHQAIEQALHTLLKTGTGYHFCTHSIERLLRYGNMVAYELPDVFPRKTEQEKQLFSLLQKAYGDARYKEDYSINMTDLLLLTERGRRIIGIASETGKSILHLPITQK